MLKPVNTDMLKGPKYQRGIIGMAAAGSMSGAKTVAVADPLNPPLDITTLTYVQQTPAGNIRSESQGFTFNADGTELHVTEIVSGRIATYDLSTAYDLTTCSTNTGTALRMSGYHKSIQWDPTGSYLFSPYYQGGAAHRRDPPTAYDFLNVPATASQTISLAASPVGIYVSPDGTKLISVWGSFSRCYEMSPAWDITSIDSGTYTQLSYSLGGAGAEDCVMDASGLVGWWLRTSTSGAAGNQVIYQYDFSTAWDLSTGTQNATSLGTNSAEPNATQLHLEQSRRELYVGYYATPGATDCIVEKYTW